MRSMRQKSDPVSPPVPTLLGSSSPLVSRERFAELVFGSTDAVGVVIGWCNKGLLPTVSVGKYSLVNLAALERVCVEKEFSL